MKKKIISVCMIICIGLILTIASATVNQKQPFEPACGGDLTQVKKGFPLPFIHVKPSVSVCNPVESFSILLEGNAYHKEFPLNFLLDLLFWSGAYAASLALTAKLRKEH